MDPRTRTFAFAILLLGLSSLVLIQAFQTSQASSGRNSPMAYAPVNYILPLQNSNSTLSTLSSTASVNQTLSTSSSLAANTTALATLSTVAVSNESTALSYLQFQMTGVSQQLSAMSSSMDALSQTANNNTLIAESGLFVGIVAFIVAIAVARRAEAMSRHRSETQPASPATGKP